MVARTLLLWSRNPLQVVYTEQGRPPRGSSCARRFAFAHGTLAGHLLAGEERFTVELAGDGSVWYDIYALSKPACLLARLAYPLARAQQRLFGRQSVEAVQSRMAARKKG